MMFSNSCSTKEKPPVGGSLNHLLCSGGDAKYLRYHMKPPTERRKRLFGTALQVSYHNHESNVKGFIPTLITSKHCGTFHPMITLKEFASLGGKARWKGKTKEEISQAMKTIAKKPRKSRNAMSPVPVTGSWQASSLGISLPQTVDTASLVTARERASRSRSSTLVDGRNDSERVEQVSLSEELASLSSRLLTQDYKPYLLCLGSGW